MDFKGFLEPKAQKYFFGAIKSTSEWHGNFGGLYITFNELVVNKGSGFDAASGTFTATQGGVYFFTIAHDWTRIKVMKNGNFEFDIDNKSLTTDEYTNFSYQMDDSVG